MSAEPAEQLEPDAELERRRERARELAAGQGEVVEIDPAVATSPPPRRRLRWMLAGLAVLLLITGGATAFLLTREARAPTETSAAPAAERTASAATADFEPAATSPQGGRELAEELLPDRRALEAATEYAERRGGSVSFATVDSRGKLRGEDLDRRFVSASVVKSLLLVAELRRLEAEGLPLDDATRNTLTAMITYSDNAAADTIYDRVGDDGLAEVAKLYGMERISFGGYWAATDIAAGDMALMFADLEQPIPTEHREFALGLLGSVIDAQRWGVPAAAEEGPTDWSVRFKGGWRPTDAGELAHQAAELRDADGTKLSIAVLTDGMPSFDYATDTVEGVAARLLAEPRPTDRGGRDEQGGLPLEPRTDRGVAAGSGR